jgi:integrase
MRCCVPVRARPPRDRRDEAIVRLLLDTGMRRGECAGLTVADVDLDQDVAVVLGKGPTARLPVRQAKRPSAGSLPACAAHASARVALGAVARLPRPALG